jgi:hypothetical protein
MRKLFVGQKPDTPLVLNVNDTQGQPVALSGYATVALLIKSPSGPMITDGTAVITILGNKLTYTWGATSIFTEPGDFHFQAKLTKAGGVIDYSTIATIEVFNSLEA